MITPFNALFFVRLSSLDIRQANSTDVGLTGLSTGIINCFAYILDMDNHACSVRQVSAQKDRSEIGKTPFLTMAIFISYFSASLVKDRCCT